MSSQDEDASEKREPLVIEQVAAALGVPVASLARRKQRAALGLVRSAPPVWCTDRRTIFFTASSVETAATRLHEYREQMSLARRGVLPASWADFSPPTPTIEQQEQKQK
ncbi:MAG: hypothetical protein DDT36_01703 [Firmicutes bacterium]|nr:hypothetical protein [Bacillota bacterium]